MVFLFQAEDGIRDLVRSRGLGDVYKRQGIGTVTKVAIENLLAQMDDIQKSKQLQFTAVEPLSLIHI